MGEIASGQREIRTIDHFVGSVIDLSGDGDSDSGDWSVGGFLELFCEFCRAGKDAVTGVVVWNFAGVDKFACCVAEGCALQGFVSVVDGVAG